MAEDAHNPDPAESERGTMDLTEHTRTWFGFWAGVKWSTIGVIVLVILLAIFRTNQ